MHLDQMPSPIPFLEEIAIPLTKEVEKGPVDIIPGFLPRMGQLIVAGPTDIGKTLVALEVCSSLVTGLPLWGRLEPTMMAGKILYVLGEHYIQVPQLLWRKTNLPMTDNVLVLGPEQLGSDKYLICGDKENTRAIDKFKFWAEGCDLVIFDPLSAFISGIEIENDNNRMRSVLDVMSRVTHDSGAACLILAHLGKPQFGRDGQERNRKTYAIRGASAIEDAATNIFYMQHGQIPDTKLPVGVKVFDMIRRKYKGDAPDKYVLQRDPETLVHTMLGPRPGTDIEAFDTRAKYDLMVGASPTTAPTEVIKMIASQKGCDERTVRNHLRRELVSGR